RARDGPVLPRRYADDGRHLPRIAGLRRRLLRHEADERTDGPANFRRMHEDRRVRTRATAQTAGRAQEPDALTRNATGETHMAFTRRTFLQAAGSGVGAVALGF